jgi:hypothetical protein
MILSRDLAGKPCAESAPTRVSGGAFMLYMGGKAYGKQRVVAAPKVMLKFFVTGVKEV